MLNRMYAYMFVVISSVGFQMLCADQVSPLKIFPPVFKPTWEDKQVASGVAQRGAVWCKRYVAAQREPSEELLYSELDAKCALAQKISARALHSERVRQFVEESRVAVPVDGAGEQLLLERALWERERRALLFKFAHQKTLALQEKEQEVARVKEKAENDLAVYKEQLERVIKDLQKTLDFRTKNAEEREVQLERAVHDRDLQIEDREATIKNLRALVEQQEAAISRKNERIEALQSVLGVGPYAQDDVFVVVDKQEK